MDGAALSVTCTTAAPTGVTLTFDYKKDNTALTGGTGLSADTFALPSTAIGTADGSYTCVATANSQTFTSDAVTLARKLPQSPLVRSPQHTLPAHSSVARLGTDDETNKNTEDVPLDGEK